MRSRHRWVRLTLAAALAWGAVTAVGAARAGDAPGTAIAVLPRPPGFHGASGGAAIEYWTTGSDGAPVRASGALLLPPGTGRDVPIIAFDHGTTGLGPRCGGQADPAGAPFPAARREEDRLMRFFLARGFAVVAPDYLGLGVFDTGPHPYLELRTEASATIDLVRAARATHRRLSRTWAVAGGSQGGQAALGAAFRHRRDAPELDFRGALALDPESDIEEFLPLARPGLPTVAGEFGDHVTAAVAEILAGLRAARPRLGVDEYLTPLGRSVLDDIDRRCLDRIDARVAGLAIGTLLARPLDDYLGVPTSGYDAPILLLLNAADTGVPSPLHAELATRLTASGTNVHVVVGAGEHGHLDDRMRNAAGDFLSRVLAAPRR
jgi:dienelactone hydrolase